MSTLPSKSIRASLMIKMVMTPFYLFSFLTFSPDLFADEPLPLYRFNSESFSEFIWKGSSVEAGGNAILLDIEGEGVIERFWFTSDRIWQEQVKKKQGLSIRSMKLKIFWDGSKTPAIDSPICDFFNQPFGPQAINNAIATSDGDLGTFCLYLPMPFRKNVRIEVHNGSENAFRVWYELSYVKKKLPDDALYLHTQYNELDATQKSSPIPLLREVHGKGRYLGTHVSAVVPNVDEGWSWYKRPVEFRIDQDEASKNPNFRFGAMDDFIGSGWWAREKDREPFEFLYYGRHHVSYTKNSTELNVAFYRYFIQDPIWFSQKLSVSTKSKKGGIWRTLSYFYLSTP